MNYLSLTTLIFSLFLASCASNSNDQNTSAGDTTKQQANTTKEHDSTIVFGQLNGGTPSFVADSTTLKKDWQKFLNSNPEIDSCKLTQIGFIINEENYYLVAHGTLGEEPIRSVIHLDKTEHGCLYKSGLTITCTTTACASETLGCLPLVTSCSPCSNSGKCTKSASNAVAIFASISPDVCSE